MPVSELVAMIAPPSGMHFERRAGEPEISVHVDLERAVELLVGDFRERRLAILVRRVRHEDIEVAELLDGLFHERAAERRIVQIARQQQARAAGRFDRFARLVRVALLFLR